MTLSEREFHGRQLLIKDGTFNWRSLSSTFTHDHSLGDDFTGRPTAVKEENLDGADHENKTKTVRPVASGSSGLSKTAQKILADAKTTGSTHPFSWKSRLWKLTDKSIRELFEAHRGHKKQVEDMKVDEEGGRRQERETKDTDKWIRKIRMGTFEDTGNCKGCVFM